ncbi:bursicon-like protein [Euroglyphus maynei]|uniref:Bursicon-like protein n=1 Tax=Euroglyphus maynei TaxID=6958 RepID=A0A1Y3BAF2_EURMA|nr:bursicon-like protein [Euroglyphus maynei]
MLHCPGQTPQYRRVTTRAPVECLCRPCSAVDEQQVKPLEMLVHNQRSHSNRPSVLDNDDDDYNVNNGKRFNHYVRVEYLMRLKKIKN